MPQKLCRLCLNSERLIYMFDSRLNSQQQLRTCILLCTGVDIRQDDLVSKHACRECCSLALKLFKFRQNALASDKALKEYEKQPYKEPPTSKEDLVKFHDSLLATVSQPPGLIKTEVDAVEVEVATVVSSEVALIPAAGGSCTIVKKAKAPLAVHRTVKALFKQFPKIIIPNELIQHNIDPKIIVTTCREDELPTGDGRNVKEQKVEGDLVELEGVEYSQWVQTAKEKRNPERKRRRSNSMGVEVMPQKKKRVFTKESTGLHKIDLPEKSPSDSETKKIIFTSSLELTSSELMATTPREEPPPLQTMGAEKYMLQVANKTVAVCQCCGKICPTWAQLIVHERVHRVCNICNTVHRTQAVLLAHWKTVCYKRIRDNSPLVKLTRVDEMADMLETYKNAFKGAGSYEDDYDVTAEELVYPSNSDDEDVVVVGEYDYLKRMEDTADFPGEREYVLKVFEKYRAYGGKARKARHAQTEPADILVKYSANHNRADVHNMHSDLSFYKVALEMTVGPKLSVHVTTTRKTKVDSSKLAWDQCQAVDLVGKMKEVRPKPPVFGQIVATSPTPAFNYVLTGAPNLFGSNIALLVAMPSSSSVTSGKVAAPNNALLNGQNSSNAGAPSFSLVSSNSLQAGGAVLQVDGEGLPAKVTGAGNATLVEAASPFLRVKSPWEINGALQK